MGLDVGIRGSWVWVFFSFRISGAGVEIPV